MSAWPRPMSSHPRWHRSPRSAGSRPERVPSQLFQTDWVATAPLSSEVPPTLKTSGWLPGSSTASPARALVGGRAVAVLRSLVTGGGHHRLPLRGHPLEDGVLRRGGRLGSVELLTLTPTGGDHLGQIVRGDPVVKIQRGAVARLVRGLVDDDGGGRCIGDGHLDVERGLTGSCGRTAGRAIDDDGADRVAQAVTGLEGGHVGTGELLELDDGDGLADAGATLREELAQSVVAGQLRRGVPVLDGRRAHRGRTGLGAATRAARGGGRDHGGRADRERRTRGRRGGGGHALGTGRSGRRRR